MGTIADLIAHRRKNETIVSKMYEDDFSTAYGEGFTLRLYKNTLDQTEHIALVKGDISGSDPVHVRMHAANALKDALAGEQTLHNAISAIEAQGRGVVVVLRDNDPEYLSKRFQNTEKSSKNDKELRNYGVGAQILQDLGIKNMILLTNNPKTPVGLDGYGLNIAGFEKIKG